MGSHRSKLKCIHLLYAPWDIHEDEMLNDCKLQRHQNWIFAISDSFDSIFDPCWQHAGHVWIPHRCCTYCESERKSGPISCRIFFSEILGELKIRVAHQINWDVSLPNEAIVLWSFEWMTRSLAYTWSNRQMWTKRVPRLGLLSVILSSH